MNLRSDYRYAIACPTSMGVRITPEDRMPVQSATRFRLQSTSAETNVLNVAASLGYECLALTRFVQDSPVAAFLKAQLRARNSAMRGRTSSRAAPGATGTSSTLPTPAPAMTSALSWFDGYTTERLPANLLQARRDYFGAHTYERLNSPRGRFFHTHWTGDGA